MKILKTKELGGACSPVVWESARHKIESEPEGKTLEGP